MPYREQRLAHRGLKKKKVSNYTMNIFITLYIISKPTYIRFTFNNSNHSDT